MRPLRLRSTLGHVIQDLDTGRARSWAELKYDRLLSGATAGPWPKTLLRDLRLAARRLCGWQFCFWVALTNCGYRLVYHGPPDLRPAARRLRLWHFHYWSYLSLSGSTIIFGTDLRPAARRLRLVRRRFFCRGFDLWCLDQAGTILTAREAWVVCRAAALKGLWP